MKKFLYNTFILLCLIVLFNPSISLSDDIDTEEEIDIESEIISASTYSETEIKEPTTNSRACVVIDRNTNTILYGKNENQKRKMASTTKIMTATIIIENCNLNDTVEVSKKAAGTGGSRLGLKTGDKITVKDLLYGLMLCSGNDAAVSLAEYCSGSVDGFAELMNSKASSLGLTSTHFETPHGLDSDGHFTTAYELAKLTNYALKNETFAKIVGTKNYTVTINGYPKNLSNTNELLGVLSGVYGVKTGFTNGANRCLVTACKRDDMDIICVVLGADTKKFRTQDSIKLINYIYDNFKIVNIKEIIDNKLEEWKNKNMQKLYINKGISQNINLQLDNLAYTSLPIRKDLINSINVNIECKTNFDAPLFANTEIGKIEVSTNNQIITTCKIYNKNEISKNTPFSYMFMFFKNYINIIEENIL